MKRLITLLLTVFVLTVFVQAQKKISELPVATTIDTADIVPIVQSGSTKSAKIRLLMEMVSDSLDDVKLLIDDTPQETSRVLYVNDVAATQVNTGWDTLMSYNTSLGNLTSSTKFKIKISGLLVSYLPDQDNWEGRLTISLDATNIQQYSVLNAADQDNIYFESEIYFNDDEANAFGKGWIQSSGQATLSYFDIDYGNAVDLTDPDSEIDIYLEGGGGNEYCIAEFLSVEIIIE